jgi:nicotinamidase-related amidase
LSPKNAAFAFIDYQPEQFAGVGSHTVDQIMPNLLLLGKAAKAWRVPVVLSTVAASTRALCRS